MGPPLPLCAGYGAQRRDWRWTPPSESGAGSDLAWILSESVH